jgi:hypothetical protein
MATNTTKTTAAKAEVKPMPTIRTTEEINQDLMEVNARLRGNAENIMKQVTGLESAYKEAQQEIQNLKAIIKAVVRYI